MTETANEWKGEGPARWWSDMDEAGLRVELAALLKVEPETLVDVGVEGPQGSAVAIYNPGSNAESARYTFHGDGRVTTWERVELFAQAAGGGQAVTPLDRLRESVESKENPATNPAGSRVVVLALTEARDLLAVVEAAQKVVQMPVRLHPIAGYMYDEAPSKILSAALAAFDNADAQASASKASPDPPEEPAG